MTTRIDQLFQQVLAEKGVTYEESLNLAREYLLLEEQELLKSQTELAEKQAKQRPFNSSFKEQRSFLKASGRTGNSSTASKNRSRFATSGRKEETIGTWERT